MSERWEFGWTMIHPRVGVVGVDHSTMFGWPD